MSKMPNIRLTSVEDLFRTDEERQTDKLEKVQIVPAERVHPYPREPYQVDRATADLVQLMEQMLDEMTPSFVKNELQVEFLHAEHAIFLEADGELLARLFGNLLNNAVKYGKEGKQIRVSMEKEGEYVVTRVINYGRIIPKQELDHIFQKFYRTEQSRSRDTGGTGLGLAIVQQIAELHHGQVRVKSDLQGTVFEVELPVGMPKGKKEDEKR